MRLPATRYGFRARSDEARNSRSCNGATSMEFMKLGMTQEHEDEDEEEDKIE